MHPSETATAPSDRSWDLFLISSMGAMFNLAIPLVLTRKLPPAEIGVYKQAFLFLGVAPFLLPLSGILNGLYAWNGKRDQEALSAAWPLIGILALLTAWMGALGSSWLSQGMGLPGGIYPYWLCALFFSILSPFFEEQWIASGSVRSGALFAAGFDALKGIAMIAAAWLSPSTLVLVGVFAGMTCLKTLAGILCFGRLGLPPQRLNWSGTGKILSYAVPVGFAGALSMFLLSADKLILAKALPQEEFAFYTMGCLSIPFLLLLEQATQRVLIPSLAADLGRAEERIRRSMLRTSRVLIPCSALLAAFSPQILSFLFTPAFAAAAPYLRLYALFYLLLILPHDALARAAQRSQLIFRVNLVFVTVIGLALLWVSRTGELSPRELGLRVLEVYLAGLFALRATLFYQGARQAGLLRPLSLLPAQRIARLLLGCGALAALAMKWPSWFTAVPLLLALLHGLLSYRLQAALGAERMIMLTPSLALGGMERMILILSRELQLRHGAKVTVIAYDDPQTAKAHLEAEFARSSIETLRFVKGPGFSLRTVWQLVWLVWQRRIPLIHTHDTGALIYGVLAKVCLLGSIRIIHTQHSFVHWTGQPRVRRYDQWFGALSDELVVPAQGLARHYAELGLEKRVTVLANGVELPESLPTPSRENLMNSLPDMAAREALRSSLQKIWVLSLGRVTPGKGLDRLLDIWSRLPVQERQRASLLILGPFSDPVFARQIQQRAQELRVQSASVHVLGASTQPWRWIDACEGVISASAFEGLPLAAIEALALGKPLFLSDIPGHRDLVAPPGAIRFFEPLEPDSSMRALVEWIRTLDAPRPRKKEADPSFRSLYGSDAMAIGYRKLYQEALSR